MAEEKHSVYLNMCQNASNGGGITSTALRKKLFNSTPTQPKAILVEEKKYGLASAAFHFTLLSPKFSRHCLFSNLFLFCMFIGLILFSCPVISFLCFFDSCHLMHHLFFLFTFSLPDFFFWLKIRKKLFLLKFILEALTKEKGSTAQGLQILLVSDNHFFQSGPFSPLDAQPLSAKQAGYRV